MLNTSLQKHQFFALKDFIYIIKHLSSNFEQIFELNMRLERIVRDIMIKDIGFLNNVEYAINGLKDDESGRSFSNLVICNMECEIEGKVDRKARVFCLLKIREKDQWRLLGTTEKTKCDCDISLGQFEVSLGDLEKNEKIDTKFKVEVFKKKKKVSKISEHTFTIDQAYDDKGVNFTFSKSSCFVSTKYTFKLTMS